MGKSFTCTDKRGIQYRDMGGHLRMAFNNGVAITDIDIESITIPKKTAEGKIVEDEKGQPVMVLMYGWKEAPAKGRAAASVDAVLADKAKKGRGTAADIMAELK